MTKPITKSMPLMGMMLMTLGMFIFPIGDAVTKHLSQDYSALTLSWFRFSIGAVVLLPFALKSLRGEQKLSSNLIFEQVVRALLVLGATVFFVMALGRIPMADTVGAYSIAPIFASILAVVLLGEGWSARKLIAVFLGFAGTLLIIRPSVSMDLGYVYALLAGFCFGGFLVANRWAKSSISPLFSIAFQTWFGMLVLSPFVFVEVLSFNTQHFWLILLMGAGSASAQLLTLISARMAPASLLAPLVYLEIVGAAFLGYWIFGNLPSTQTWVGIVIIISAGLLLLNIKKSADP